MNHAPFRPVLLLATLLGSVSAACANEAPLTPYADLRYRLELVDQQGIENQAAASTIRLRGGVKTAEWNGFSALIEGEAIQPLGVTRYNDTVNGKTAYPVVADPADVLLNQAFVRWKPAKELEAVAGRQAVNLDNQRWIGSVGWRQNDQTLDAARLTMRPVKGVTVDYLHAWRVNRVFGPDSRQGIWRDTAINALRSSYTIKNIGTLSAYGYWLDLPPQPASSSKTLGVRMAGELPVGKGLALLYAAEYARQQDFARNPRQFALDYLLLEPGVKAGALVVKGGLERLEGDGTVALQTPLATLHAFNGWADKFLTTPAHGLRDLYIDASYQVGGKRAIKGLLLRGAWHGYRSTFGDIAYGQEWNALASYPVDKTFAVSAKLARYEAKAFATDTTKVWFSVEARF